MSEESSSSLSVESRPIQAQTQTTSAVGEDSINTVLQQSSEITSILQDDLKELQRKVQATYLELEKQRKRQQMLTNFKKNSPQEPQTSAPPPSSAKRRKYEHISADMKAEVVRNVLYEKRMSWEEASAAFGISRASISRIRKQELQREEPSAQQIPKKRGRHPSLNAEHLIFILDLLEKNSQLTLKELVAEIEKKYEIETSESSLERELQKMEITWKKPSFYSS